MNSVELYVHIAAAALRQRDAMVCEFSGVRLSRDIEPLHRMRVASRRLRAALRLLEKLFGVRLAQRRRVIKKAARTLGRARELDIQLKFLAGLPHCLNTSQYKLKLKPLLARLTGERRASQRDIEALLDDPALKHALAGLNALLTATKNVKNPAILPQRRCHEVVLKQFDKMQGYRDFVYYPHKEKKLHALRIAAKNLRYTMEVTLPVYGRSAGLGCDGAHALQEVLGDLRERDVWRRTLRGYPELGFLDAYCRDERAEVYKKFIRVWEKLQKDRIWKKLKAVL